MASTLTLGAKTKVADERDTFGVPVKDGSTETKGSSSLVLLGLRGDWLANLMTKDLKATARSTRARRRRL